MVFCSLPRVLGVVVPLLGLGFLPAFAADPPSAPPVHIVSLKTSSMPLDEVLGKLSMESSIPVRAAAEVGMPAISLNLEKVPFWKALDTIATQADARPYLYSRDGKIVLQKGKRDSGQPISYSGPFRVALQRISAVHNFETGTRDMTALVQVAWEPSLLPLYIQTRATQVEIHDGKDRPVEPAQQGSVLVSTTGRMAISLDLPLPSLPRSEAKLALLKGQFLVRAPSKMLTFTLGNVEKLSQGTFPVVLREEGTNCQVNSIMLRNKRWTIDVTYTLPPGGPTFESYESWIGNSQMYLLNQKTRRTVMATASELEDSSSRRAHIRYHFEDTGNERRGNPGDWTVFYHAPAAITEWPVPFRFTEIPLP